MFIRRKRKKYKTYTDIDILPVWNYNKVKETNEYRYLLKLEDYLELPKIDFDLSKIWEDINFQIIDTFGIGQKELMILHKIRDIHVMKIDFVLNQKRDLITRLKILQKQLEQLQKTDDKKQNFEEQVAILESHFKIPFDTFKMSIKRYFSYIKLFDKYVEDAKISKKMA